MANTRSIAPLVLLTSLFAERNAAAYMDQVHVYATTALISETGLPEPTRLAIALCAQLPDEATEINAVKAWGSAAISGYVVFPKLQRDWAAAQLLFTAQHLFHGLTGGEAKPLQHLANSVSEHFAESIRKYPDDLDTACALGFALHLLGDSRAHVQIDSPTTMYPTGLGHASDGNDPDRVYHKWPLRKDLWEDYIQVLGELLNDMESARKIKERVSYAATQRRGFSRLNVYVLFNSYFDQGDSLFRVAVGSIFPEKFQTLIESLESHTASSCADALKRIGMGLRINCEAALKMYSSFVIAQFGKPEFRGSRDADLQNVKYRNPFKQEQQIAPAISRFSSLGVTADANPDPVKPVKPVKPEAEDKPTLLTVTNTSDADGTMRPFKPMTGFGFGRGYAEGRGVDLEIDDWVNNITHDMPLQLVGHTDKRGSERTNCALGLSRAKFAKGRLIKRRRELSNKILVSSSGFSELVRRDCQEDDDICHSENRRVEVRSQRSRKCDQYPEARISDVDQ